MHEGNADIARLTAEVSALKDSVRELKDLLERVVALTETVATMGAENRETTRALDRQQAEITAIRSAMNAGDDDGAAVVAEFRRHYDKDVRALADGLSTVRGGVRVAHWVVGVTVAVFIAISGWMFTTVFDLRDRVVILEIERKFHVEAPPVAGKVPPKEQGR